MMPMDRPVGIIITIGEKWLKERGYRNWYRDFMQAMNNEGYTYWLRQGNKPTVEDLLYVYICIHGKIRFRTLFVQAEGAGYKDFTNGNRMFANAWVVVCGPVVKAPFEIKRKGFQGFRYTEQLF